MFILCPSSRKITVERSDILVSDSMNVYPVQFKFSCEWRGLTKTAVFRTKDKSIEILLDNTNICNIPWELLLKHGRKLEVGVYGTKGEDLILNTIWCPLGEIYEGAKNIDSENHPEEPTPDVYQQILSQMGNLEDLETEDKSSLVNAINEMYNMIDSGGCGGGGGEVTAGVSSFNGRTGTVLPQSGDYTADMVNTISKEDFDNFNKSTEDTLDEIKSELNKIPIPMEALTNLELDSILK